MAKDSTPGRTCVMIRPGFEKLYPSLMVDTPYPLNELHPTRGEGLWLERAPDPSTWVLVSEKHVIPLVPVDHERFDSCARAMEALEDAPKLPARRELRKKTRRK